jgi:hypothetical protein
VVAREDGGLDAPPPGEPQAILVGELTGGLLAALRGWLSGSVGRI